MQHGFLSGKSTTKNILESLADWTLTLKNRHLVDIFYVDFDKAFDAVCHNKLFHKLRSFGINGNLLKWIQDLLTNRTLSLSRWVGYSATKSKFGERSLAVGGPSAWNALPESIREAKSINIFKCKLKTHFLDYPMILDGTVMIVKAPLFSVNCACGAI